MKTIHLLFLLLFLLNIPIESQAEDNLPTIDISQQQNRNVIIAKGKENLYNGHPSTVMLDDNKTIFCVWSLNHGGPLNFLSISRDGGKKWVERKIPNDWKILKNCPLIYKLTDKNGVERLMIFTSYPKMGQTFSEDSGNTWSSVKSLGITCNMPFTSIVRKKNGDYIGFYHLYEKKNQSTLFQAISKDGGLTWGEYKRITKADNRQPCEPYVFKSSDDSQLVCIARNNSRIGPSLMMVSKDEGETWSELKDTPWELTGDRHVVKYTIDGKIIITFRDMSKNPITKKNFVAWVGQYDTETMSFIGSYKINLLKSYDKWDCGYSGLEILPDGTVIATTYIKYKPGKDQQSIVSVRFKLEEIENMLRVKKNGE
ncbi:sialidase family protein [Dysgonomonas gadei]|uniref:sialidase family protein n=1 Tax=Dysgonomonas gadei TaxID=156974 RepID=UPI003AF0228C